MPWPFAWQLGCYTVAVGVSEGRGSLEKGHRMKDRVCCDFLSEWISTIRVSLAFTV